MISALEKVPAGRYEYSSTTVAVSTGRLPACSSESLDFAASWWPCWNRTARATTSTSSKSISFQSLNCNMKRKIIVGQPVMRWQILAKGPR